MRKYFYNSPQLLLWIVVSFVLLIAGFLIIDNYRTQLALIKDRELAKLEGIAATVAVMIDGNEHRNLMMKHDGMDAIQSSDEDSVYYAMHNMLKGVLQAHSIETSVYTMVYEPSIDKFCYLVTGAEEPYWKHAYRDYPPELLKNYEKGGRLDTYVDSKGTWLSAFYPIRTASGETVGIVQVEKKFDDFLAEAQAVALRNSAISVGFSAFIFVILFITLRIILKQMTELRREQNELETLRKELLANVSHDLRTPLASIQGYLETVLYLDDIEEDRKKQYLQTALVSTERLKGLIDELFELSRLDSRERKPEIEPFSIADLVSDVVAGLRITAAKKGVTLLEEIPHNTPAVQADIALINRVIQNLVSNSIQYTESGGTVRVSINEDDNNVHIHVIDTGVGIPPEELAAVFERFKTVDSHKRKGSGLGLAIVKSILDAHESFYEFNSQPGEGSHFHFILPKA